MGKVGAVGQQIEEGSEGGGTHFIIFPSRSAASFSDVPVRQSFPLVPDSDGHKSCLANLPPQPTPIMPSLECPDPVLIIPHPRIFQPR